MNAHRRAKWREVEDAYGKPFWEIVQDLARRGLSQRQVGELVGYSRRGFALCLRDGPEIEWAPLATRMTKSELSDEARENIRAANRAQNTVTWITIDGETRTLREWAQVSGLSEKCVWKRYKKGWRDLLAPPMSHRERGRRGQAARREHHAD